MSSVIHKKFWHSLPYRLPIWYNTAS